MSWLFGKTELNNTIPSLSTPQKYLKTPLISANTIKSIETQYEISFKKEMKKIIESFSDLISKESKSNIIECLEIAGLAFPEYCEAHFNDISSELEDMEAPDIWLSSLFPLSVTIRDALKSKNRNSDFGSRKKKRRTKRS